MAVLLNKQKSIENIDDGTNYVIYCDGTAVMKIRKSDNQLLLDAGVDTDAF